MKKLKGKTAFVSGTSQGIGAAIASELIDAGCNICMHYFHSSEEPERLQKIAIEKGQKAICVQGDLRKENEVKRCISEATAQFPVFDILVNNTGSLVGRKTLSEVDLSFWNSVIEINMTTMMLVMREMLPFLNNRDGSSVINVASLAGRKGGHSGSLVYSTAKGAVITWTRSLSAELGQQGIRVNAVAPGFIEGTLFHKTFTSRESAIKTIQGIPLGRSGNPDDVARIVRFLASEYDGFITGATIDVNGGVYCA